jgi:hypothetical protein
MQAAWPHVAKNKAQIAGLTKQKGDALAPYLLHLPAEVVKPVFQADQIPLFSSEAELVVEDLISRQCKVGSGEHRAFDGGSQVSVFH